MHSVLGYADEHLMAKKHELKAPPHPPHPLPQPPIKATGALMRAEGVAEYGVIQRQG